MIEQRGIKIPLSSGFTVLVKPLPPYYLDFLDDKLPFLDYPTRKIQLASGDTIDFEYVLPKTVPDESNAEEYELYFKYKSVETKNISISKQRERMRSDFLLSNCVVIEDGPIKFEDNDWVLRLEAAIPNYKVPTHVGQRILAFLKSNVITKVEERDVIVQTACFQEVNLQGIIDALLGFQVEMEQQTTS